MEDGSGSGSIPMDFLRELDYWLLEANSVMSPAASRAGMAGLGSPSWMSEAMGIPPPMPQTQTQTQATRSTGIPGDAQPQAAMMPFPGAEQGNALLSQPQAPAPAPVPPVPTSSPANTSRRRPATPATSSSSSTTGPPPRKKGKTNKSTSQRQKEELAFLRSTITQLEDELDKLKRQSRNEKQQQEQEQQKQNGDSQTIGEMSTALVTRGGESENGPTGQSNVSLWERISKRQQEEKTKAEVENAKLREMVEGQIRLVKSFERLLRKRRIWEQLQESSWQQHEAEERNEEEVFEELLRDVDARYPQVDAVLEEHGLGDVDPSVGVGDDANMKYSATDGMYLEFKEKKFMPFEYRTMDEVVWRSFKEGKLKLLDSNLMIVKETPDMYFSKSTLPPSVRSGASNDDKDSTGGVILAVMKRFHEQDRIVYVWVAKVQMDYPREHSGPDVQILQKGCSVTSSATLPDLSVGSINRSYTRSVPTLKAGDREDGKLLQEQHREVGLLTEMVFASYQQSRQMINQSLENLLLDEMMAKSRGAAPSAPEMQ